MIRSSKALAAALLGVVPSIQAATISEGIAPDGSVSIDIQGPITAGDVSAFIEVATEVSRGGSELRVTLESPGGDFVEALAIGRLVRKLNATTIAHGIVSEDQKDDPKRCYSACFLIFTAGSIRDPEDNVWYAFTNKEVRIPVLGVHRPYIERATFSQLTLSEAKSAYKQIETETREYLAELGVPVRLADLMFATASDRGGQNRHL